MKKLLLLVSVIASALTFITTTASAQNVVSNFATTSTALAAKTTLTNVDTVLVTGAVKNSFFRSFSAIVRITKTSGTVAGTIIFQGSHNGTVWADLQTTSLADATKVYAYNISPSAYNYYRAFIVTSGTQVIVVASATYAFKGLQ